MPAEQRRAQRRAALLEAGLEVLGRHGWATATVRGVCKQAGLNDRYFYENFADLDALLLAVVDDQAAQGTAVILTAAEAAPHRLRARARAVVEAIVDFLSADPRRGRILAQEFSAHPLLQQRRRRIIRTLASVFTAQTRELLDEVPLSPADLHLTALTVTASLTVTAGLWDLLADWFRGDLDTGRDHLVDYVVAFLLTTTELAPALQHRLR
ncbi:TetR/AcrR family transcriptional regulator [Planomonospora parontospora]|uniref:TetR/AcrR family transcriptional regulator n=1 Tax=Planomonospora parontospora TaxID=58119 RepID=UPI0016713E57|nr:TetR/AcrR family transcriptional regulator [Planomonospora parontospora]GGL54282.1 putative transcriptional regulator, TetR family protein [Planomonospora parontospora subsp. antibiotica]GII19721.1 putative transcriptional regulator, TetR family protein [Planomonospora parontospora subsp. antibiotica]